MIDIQGISRQFGSKVLFDGASARIGARSKLALVGPNGSGKTTLIKMILGHEEPDSGRIIRATGLSIGHLAQEVPRSADRTVLEEALRMDGRREELLRTRSNLEQRLADPGHAATGAGHEDLERYGRILEELEALDEYRIEAKAKEILEGIGFRPADFHRKLTEFSGGWLMRVALARILLMSPDLLLLDEPTNHLDLESLLWLEDFLRGFRGAILLVSHDTEFVNRLVGEVVEIDQRKLWTYRGNLESYAAQKEERLQVLRSQAAGQQARIAEIEAFVRRFGAKATKARQAQSRLKQLEKIESELVELPEERDRVGFRFPPAPRSGREVMTLRRARVEYPGKVVFQDLDWTLMRGSRVAIVGRNGAGKSTLLKVLSGAMAPTSGEGRLGHEVRVGYYAQIQAESLDYSATILQELERTAPELPVSRVRGIAGAFLFSGDAVEKKCSVLSGGEKARVALAKLLLSPSNFLILDEPTNHLDVESRGVLLEALQDYEGTLVIVSHDRAFMSGLVDTLLEIEPGEGSSGSKVIPLLGSYEEYLSRKQKEIAEQGARMRAASSAVKEASRKPVEEAPKARAGVSNNMRRSWERQREKLEEEISKLEGRISELDGLLASDSTYSDKAAMLKLMEDRRVCQRDLEDRMSQWEKVCSDLEIAGS